MIESNIPDSLHVEVLGSGTSTGIPVPGCNCEVCCSDDPKDTRLRCAILVTAKTKSCVAETKIVIDTPPDFRAQVLRAQVKSLDAVLYTHTHADHVFGLDDIRAFTFHRQAPLPVYADQKSSEELKRLFGYAFVEDERYEGGAPPRLAINTVEPPDSFLVKEIAVKALRLNHGALPILGFRIGNFAYLTDCSDIPQSSKDHLQGLDCLIIDGLRERPHKTHFTHQQALSQINELKPKRAYLTHISHDISHARGEEKIRNLSNGTTGLAFDGLTIEIKN